MVHQTPPPLTQRGLPALRPWHFLCVKQSGQRWQLAPISNNGYQMRGVCLGMCCMCANPALNPK